MRPAVNALARHFRVLTFTLAGEWTSNDPVQPRLGFDSYTMQVDRVLVVAHAHGEGVERRRVDLACVEADVAGRFEAAGNVRLTGELRATQADVAGAAEIRIAHAQQARGADQLHNAQFFPTRIER